MIYQTLDCGNKGWFWLTFAAVGWQPKVCCIDDARRAGKKARFGSCGGFFYYWRRTRRPSALRRPPTIWRASLHLCYLRERQAANNCTSTLANFSFNTILYLPPPSLLSRDKYFPPSPRRHYVSFLGLEGCVYSYFLRVEGRTHLRGCRPSGEKRMSWIILSTPLLPRHWNWASQNIILWALIS